MATYTCNSCGMSVKTLCGSCDEPLVDGSLTTDDGKVVQTWFFSDQSNHLKELAAAGVEL